MDELDAGMPPLINLQVGADAIASSGMGSGSSTGTGGGSETGTGAATGTSEEEAGPPPSCQETCSSGCCDSNGMCQQSNNLTCGLNGVSCVNCSTMGDVCFLGGCTPSTASTGASEPSSGTSSGTGGTAGFPGGVTPPTGGGGGGCCQTMSCFPLGLPCCTSSGGCGCIALYFLPCK